MDTLDYTLIVVASLITICWVAVCWSVLLTCASLLACTVGMLLVNMRTDLNNERGHF